ncbi:MAG: hypothetical protein HY908_14420 [Myxococcales bacterium]|nr:hypothetical protein [Myxococcales bacterium]
MPRPPAPAMPGTGGRPPVRDAVPKEEETDALFDALIDAPLEGHAAPEPAHAAPHDDADATQERHPVVETPAPAPDDEASFDSEATAIFDASASGHPADLVRALAGRPPAPHPDVAPPPAAPAEISFDTATPPAAVRPVGNLDEGQATHETSQAAPLPIDFDSKAGFVFTDEGEIETPEEPGDDDATRAVSADEVHARLRARIAADAAREELPAPEAREALEPAFGAAEVEGGAFGELGVGVHPAGEAGEAEVTSDVSVGDVELEASVSTGADDEGAVFGEAEGLELGGGSGGELAAFATDDETVAAPETADDGAAPAEAVDAVVGLMQRGERDAWIARAVWLHEELPDASQPAERARALLVISELHAMAGEDAEAERLAREALELQPSSALARRQVRSILVARGDWSAALVELDAEIRVAPTPAAQAHSACLAADVARIVQEDQEGCAHRLDQAQRAVPTDARPLVHRVAASLAAGDELGKLGWPEDPSLGSLAAACQVLSAVRGAEPTGDGSPYLQLLGARSAIKRRDLGASLTALERLEQAGAGPAAAWLAGALGAAQGDGRQRAMEALRRAAEGTHPALAQRLVASTALEGGDVNAARALLSYASEEALSAADRLALAGLLGLGKGDDLGRWLDAVGQRPDQAALAAASAAVASDPASATRVLRDVGTDLSRAASALGRRLAAEAHEGPKGRDDDEDATTLDDVARTLLDADATSGEARAVRLELAYRGGDPTRVSDVLVGSIEQAPGMEREAALAAAMLAELDGNHARRKEALERVRQASPELEAGVRLGLEGAESAAVGAQLAAHADALEAPLAGAVAFTEAALHYLDAGLDADAEPLLRRATELAPELPIPWYVAYAQALRANDAEAQRSWLQQRREHKQGDPVADMVREAMLLGPDEQEARAALLAEAHALCPDDYGLRELYETSAGGAATDRATWLVGRARTMPATEGAPLALEAALHFELAGKLDQAAACSARAMADVSEPLAPLFVERLALAGHGTDALVSELSERVRQAESVAERREVYEQLAELELRGRGDGPAALSWLQQILQETPDDLPTLHRVERVLVAARAATALEPVALALAKTLDGPEALAHAMLAAHLRYRAGAWEAAAEPVEIGYRHVPTSVWALRHVAAHAAASKNQALAAEAQAALAGLTNRPLEQATLLLRASEATGAAGDEGRATALLESALEHWPEHYLGRLERASLLERAARAADAAAAFEELAQIALAPQARCAHLYRAASLWLSLGTDDGQNEGQRLLEAVSSIDPAYEDAFERLRAIYLATGAKMELAELLGARLATIEDPAERVQMEVLRGRMLVESGAAAEAKAALAAALELAPDNPDALGAYSEVCAAESDWEGVEQALIQLARLVADPPRQAEIYLRLGALYDAELANPERAELAYLEVLKHVPNDARARDALCTLYLAAGDTKRAFEQQEALIEAASTPADKCARTVRLSEIHEAAGDLKEAEATLQKARRTWPKEPAPVGALYQLFQRAGQDAQADQLMERAAADVRRGLGAGRFEAPLFRMAAMVAELRGELDAARVTEATLSALEGEQPTIAGVGLAAGRVELDRHLAPEPFGPAFRTLLKASGALLDEAVPLDPKSLRTKPLPPPQQDLEGEVLRIAAAYGIPQLSLHVTPALGHVCVPASVEPPVLVLGQALVTTDDLSARDFLLHRAVKVLQAGTAALSRTAPIDLWPLLAAFLRMHIGTFAPQGVDLAKVNEYHSRMAKRAPRAFEPALVRCAQEVAEGIGNRASSLNHVANAWGSRAALLALGDPLVAMRALSWATSGTALPTTAADRQKWIGRQAEARDLVVFSVSEDYIAARLACGGELASIDDSSRVPTLERPIPEEVLALDASDEDLVAGEIEFDDA